MTYLSYITKEINLFCCTEHSSMLKDSLKWLKKSAPTTRYTISATTNSRRTFPTGSISTHNFLETCVLTGVPFAATTLNYVSQRRGSSERWTAGIQYRRGTINK
uniref:Uncharacterized protein n=1 Tax=Lepeophtheirus salmonis TaxID=72036 RepID=A0A0K2THY0_LEPSM